METASGVMIVCQPYMPHFAKRSQLKNEKKKKDKNLQQLLASWAWAASAKNCRKNLISRFSIENCRKIFTVPEFSEFDVAWK